MSTNLKLHENLLESIITIRCITEDQAVPVQTWHQSVANLLLYSKYLLMHLYASEVLIAKQEGDHGDNFLDEKNKRIWLAK